MRATTKKHMVRRNGRPFNFFFIEPQEGTDALASARELAKLNGVEEVMVTSGQYGFVMKSRSDPAVQQRIEAYVSRKYRRFRLVDGHFGYAVRKGRSYGVLHR